MNSNYKEGRQSPPTKKMCVREIHPECASIMNISQNHDLNSHEVNGTKDFESKNFITAQSFKDIIYSHICEDFKHSHHKLNCGILPECCEHEACVTKHKGIKPNEITTLGNGNFFTILDNPLLAWMRDISMAAFSVLRPDLYFRGDVLRIFFYYILDGPNDSIMWDVKHIISSHIYMHPPCLELMRDFYLSLLSKAYAHQSYFKNTELTKSGVLYHVIDHIELLLTAPDQNKQQEEEQKDYSDTDKVKEENSLKPNITFEVLERRWNNFEPLLDNEYQEITDALEDLETVSVEPYQAVLYTNKKLQRFTIAIQLITDILETDFLICVSKMKEYILSKRSDVVIPLVKHFIGDGLYSRLFRLFTISTNQALWTQLLRLISLMAEFEHIFLPCPKKSWCYPNLHPRCEWLANSFFNTIKSNGWTEEERILRMETIKPPWLRLLITMHWLNTDLLVGTGSDLKAVVDILHMHIVSPVKLEKDIQLTTSGITKEGSKDLLKKARKRNQYGETLLHKLCKKKTSTKSLLLRLLASPGIDVNVKDNYGWTPLHEAVGGNCVFATKALLQYNPPPGMNRTEIGIQNSEGITPLHEAVRQKNLEICRLLLDYGGACLLWKSDKNGLTPLVMAENNREISKFFYNTIKTLETTNLSPDSLLNISDSHIHLLIMACNDIFSDYHTLDIYRSMKFSVIPKRIEHTEWVVLNKVTLQQLKTDQCQFKKLRKILIKLAENPRNASIVVMWESMIQSALHCKK